MFQCLVGNNTSCHNHSLFVGESDNLARTDSMKGRLQSGKANDGRHHHIDTVHLDHIAGRLDAGKDLDVGMCQCVANLIVFGFVGDNHHVGVDLKGLFD